MCINIPTTTKNRRENEVTRKVQNKKWMWDDLLYYINWDKIYYRCILENHKKIIFCTYLLSLNISQCTYILQVTYIIFFFPITEPISFMDTPIFQNATENKDATIRCEVKGNPEPSVSWYYNGQQIVCKYTYLLHFFFRIFKRKKMRF